VVKFVTLVVAMSSFCVISLARADDKPTQEADAAALFAQLDTNQDGQLTIDEVPEDKRRLFERLLRLSDKNGDGKLDRDEFSAGIQRKPQETQADRKPPDGPDGRPGPEKIFQRLDANGDGKITLDEVPEPRKERFKTLIERADKDGDGALSQQEFAAAFQNLRAAFAGQPGEGRRPDGAVDAQRIFRRIDKNGDGKLTLDEVPEDRRPMFERIFKRAGKTGDQGLTPEEFSAALRGPRPPFPPGGRRETTGARLPPGGLFMALDTDHDGKLSSAEISAAAEVLKKLDKNGDGAITIDELLPPPPEKRGND
jgi:Ca2+-binding EF-hand superfamily protein